MGKKKKLWTEVQGLKFQFFWFLWKLDSVCIHWNKLIVQIWFWFWCGGRGICAIKDFCRFVNSLGCIIYTCLEEKKKKKDNVLHNFFFWKLSQFGHKLLFLSPGCLIYLLLLIFISFMLFLFSENIEECIIVCWTFVEVLEIFYYFMQ